MSTIQLRLDDDDPWIIEKKIFDTLDEFLQPSSTLATSATARVLDNLFPTNRSQEDQPDGEQREEAGSFLWHMWDVFHQVARQLPHASLAQDRLAALVKELSHLSSQTPVISLKAWGEDFKLWQDLPLLGPTFREQCDTMGPGTDEGRQPWRNVNAYAARLTRDGSVNLKGYGIRALAGAFEGEMVRAHDHAHPSRVRSDFTPGPELDCLVAVAADWISLCGPSLLDNDEDVAGGDGGPAWDGKAGLSLERWQFWKQRFGEIGEHDKIDKQTRQIAKVAKDRMEEIEQSGKPTN